MQIDAATCSGDILSLRARTGAPHCASTAFTPMERMNVLFPAMFGPLRIISCARPSRRRSFSTALPAGSSGCARRSASNIGPARANSGNAYSGCSNAKLGKNPVPRVRPLPRSRRSSGPNLLLPSLRDEDQLRAPERDQVERARKQAVPRLNQIRKRASLPIACDGRHAVALQRASAEQSAGSDESFALEQRENLGQQ